MTESLLVSRLRPLTDLVPGCAAVAVPNVDSAVRRADLQN